MRRSVGSGVFVRAILLLVGTTPSLICKAQPQQPPAATAAAPASYKPLTVDRIYSEPS
jgi:hypothetical protein